MFYNQNLQKQLNQRKFRARAPDAGPGSVFVYISEALSYAFA